MKHKNLYILLIFLILLNCGFGQSDSFGEAIDIAGENYRLYPSQVLQSEVFIVNSPIHPDVLFAASNTLTFTPFFVSEGIYVTANGGINWYGNDTCTGTPINFHGGDPGIAIDKNGTFILTRLGRAPLTGLYSHFSTDNGITWSDAQVISTDDLERASLKSDMIAASLYYGRTYAAWVKFAFPFPVVFSSTDDVGQNWKTPVPINSPSNRSAGGDLAIGPDGEVYAVWAGVAETSPFKEILVGFARSVNGGADWAVIESAFTVNGITGVLPDKGNIRVNGLPALAVDTTDGPRRGWLYIVTGQTLLEPAGTDPDIILYRSTDKGITWSGGIRVNQDAMNNSKIQYFPSVHVDRFGAVNVIFYDDRNTTSDSTGVFLARSVDGGNNWSEYEISDHRFKPQPIGGLGQGYQGDNIDITSTPTQLWPVWMDNSSGIYQVWTAPINFTTIDAIEEYKFKKGFWISEVFPNPTTDFVNIGFRMDRSGKVSVKIFNIHGELISHTFSDFKHLEDHTITIGLSGLSSSKGVFFIYLEANGKSDHAKLIKSR